MRVVRRQMHLALILARELASQLATATFISDADGDLVFYNEAAEEQHRAVETLAREFGAMSGAISDAIDAVTAILPSSSRCAAGRAWNGTAGRA
jgi:NAD(P)H-dependent FMN reductase